MDGKVLIRFTASAGAYNAGDVAGFESSVARAYVLSGVAVTMEQKQEPKAVSAPPAHKQIEEPEAQKSEEAPAPTRRRRKIFSGD